MKFVVTSLPSNLLSPSRTAVCARSGVRPGDEADAWQLFEDREDKNYSFTDCTSFAIMRRLGLRRAATLDEDFEREGLEVVP